MKKSKLLISTIISLFVLTASSVNHAQEKDFDPEVAADAVLRSAGIDPDKSVANKAPASGFWTCHGIRMHMGVDMGSWTDLDTGERYTQIETGQIDEQDKDEKIKGTDYLYALTRNPAVIKYFIVDKSGKSLYIRDDVNIFKTYKCKRN
ncbi:TPA: hypothetical protein ACTYBS_005047 [Citrobacter freundii]|nr:hypothetical protein [Escherichia coli]